jgi:hypothetical protein
MILKQDILNRAARVGNCAQLYRGEQKSMAGEKT